MESGRTDGRAARAFARFTSWVHSKLPRPLKRIPETFIGYALINGSAFGLDMLFLTLFHGWGRITYPVAVTMGYALACVFAFLLNRWLNFRSHGHLGSQSAKYMVVAVSNYVIWILGFSWLLEAVGVEYRLARFSAACVEGVYLYVLMRWWVFRRRSGASAPVEAAAAADAAPATAHEPVR